MLLEVIHHLGEQGIPARRILDDVQAAKLAVLDELRSFITVTGMEVSSDTKTVAMTVHFEQTLPRGTSAGMEALVWDGREIQSATPGLDLDVHGAQPGGKFTVSCLGSGHRLEKGDTWARVYRQRGGWKPWDLAPGTPMVLNFYVYWEDHKVLKERLGDDWFPMPSTSRFCATAEAPDLP